MNKFTQSIFIFIFLALYSIITAITSLAIPSTVQIFVDGIPLYNDQPAVIRNGRTMVPFNALFSALGANVTWNEKEQKVTGTKGDLNVELFINKSNANVKGQSVTMDTPVQIINGRTMVPLKFVSSYLGASVAWDGVNYAAYVSTGMTPDIFDPSLPVITPVIPPVTPITPTVPLITAPAKDTASKSNVLAGTYVAENLSSQRFAIQFNSSLTADIRSMTTDKVSTGTYSVSTNSVTISSDLLSGSFNMEELTYNGRKIILLKDTSNNGQKTLAMAPVSYEEFVKAYIAK